MHEGGGGHQGGELGDLHGRPEDVAREAAQARGEKDSPEQDGTEREAQQERAPGTEEPSRERPEADEVRGGGPAGQSRLERCARSLPWRGRGKKRGDQKRREPADAGRDEEHRRASRRRQGVDGARGDQEMQDEPGGAEYPEPAVPHDGDAVVRIGPRETVQGIGEPVKMDAAGQDLPEGEQEKSRQERGKGEGAGPIGADEERAQSQPDGGKPPGRAPDGSVSGGFAPRHRHDGQEPDRQYQVRQAMRAVRRERPGSGAPETRAAWRPRSRAASSALRAAPSPR